ncbi:MAG: hypothetical protein R6V46_03940 [Desulfatiglandaceae bacterium]
MPVISFIFSIIAILLSAGSIYLTHLEPFSPTIVPSDPMWSFETVDLDKGKRGLALIVPTAFLNEGAKPGCLDDMRLSLHSYKESKDIYFFPIVFIDYTGFVNGKPKGESVYQHCESTFAPLVMTGKESFTKTIVFVSRSGLSPEELKEGKYRIEFVFFERDKNEGTKFHSAEYALGQGIIDSLKAGKAWIPLNEKRDTIRSK